MHGMLTSLRELAKYECMRCSTKFEIFGVAVELYDMATPSSDIHIPESSSSSQQRQISMTVPYIHYKYYSSFVLLVPSLTEEHSYAVL